MVLGCDYPYPRVPAGAKSDIAQRVAKAVELFERSDHVRVRNCGVGEYAVVQCCCCL